MVYDDKITLATKIKWFEDAEIATTSARGLSERDRDYYNNIQWTSAEVQELKSRGQPVITINRIKRKIDYLNGLERQGRTNPKAYPRTPQHEKDAEAITDALRYVSDANDFQQIRSAVCDNMIVEGYGGAEVMPQEMQDGTIDIRIKHIPWDRIFYDPHASKPDFSDAKYLGYVIWKDSVDAQDDYPESAEMLQGLVSSSGTETYDDKPRSAWVDSARSRVRIVQMYYRQGSDWFTCTFTSGIELIRATPVPFRDEWGVSECPIVLQSAYITRENERFGIVREMISPQDEINKRRSKSLHLLNARNVIAEKGAVQDISRAKRELAKPDGWLEKTPGTELQIQPMGDLVAGQFQLLQEAKSELDLMGPNAAMGGKDQRQQSGRAIQAQQAGGGIELTPLIDRLNHWQKRVFRQVFNRIKEYWTEERWIRVTDDEKNIKWVGLNQPITFGDRVRERAGGNLPPEMEMLMNADPRSQVVIGKQHDVSRMVVDIIMDEQPDVAIIQQEQFEQLAQMVSSGLPIPPDAIIEASGLRSEVKRRILERMKGTEDPAAQAKAQMQMDGAQAEVSKTKAEAAKSAAQAQEIMARTIAPPMQFSGYAGDAAAG